MVLFASISEYVLSSSVFVVEKKNFSITKVIADIKQKLQEHKRKFRATLFDHSLDYVTVSGDQVGIHVCMCRSILDSVTGLVLEVSC